MKHTIAMMPITLCLLPSLLAIACDNAIRVGENTFAPDADVMDSPVAAEASPVPPTLGCCDVGALQRLGKVGQQGSPPAAVWNGKAWTVAWQNYDSQNLVLATIAAESGALTEQKFTDIQLRPFGGTRHPSGVALVGKTSLHRPGSTTPYEAALMIFNEEGGLKASVALPEGTEDAAVRYWRSQNLWAVFTYAGASTSNNARLHLLDTLLNPVEIDSRRNVRRGCTYGDYRSVALINFGDNLAAICPSDGIKTTIIDKTVVEPWPEGRQDPVENVVRISVSGLTTIAATSLNNRIFVGGTTTGLSLLWSHAGSRETIVGPSKVASTHIVSHPNSPSMAADEQGQTMGFCYLDRVLDDSEHQSVKFALLDAQGNLIGEPVTAIPNMRYSNACAVSAGPADTYLVAAWLSGGPVAEPMVAVKVTARR